MGKSYLEAPIIFLGPPRSGTSVISEIVMRHRDLAYPSQYQTRFLGNTGINYLRRLGDNSLWRYHGQKKQLNKVSPLNYFIFRSVEAYPMWDHIVREGLSFSKNFLIGETATPEEKKKVSVFFRKLVRKQGKKRLAFKITGPSRLHYLLSIFPDAKVVKINRDPIAVVNSLMRVNFWQNRGMKDFWWQGAYTQNDFKWLEANRSNSALITGYQIKRVMEVTDKEIQELEPSVLEVSYSGFVDDPQNTIAQILSHTGLSDDSACYDYLKKNKIHNQNKRNSTFFSDQERKMLNALFLE